MENRRKELLQKLWSAQDEAYELMAEYDSLPHIYGSVVLYQAEALVVNLIGEHSDITITELGSILKKTASACSQIVRKLKSKGLVEQVRNESNNRQLNLRLTDAGKQIYLDRLSLNLECQNILFQMLQEFSDEEIAHHIAVQERINQAYRGDIDRSKISVTD